MAISNQDLRKAGLKVTLPRIKILELLENSKQHHLRAEDIYKTLLEQGEDVGLATVYRVLTHFETAGIIQRHNFENSHSVFESMKEDHHNHLVCLNCNKVVEFTNDIIEQEQHKVAEQYNFHLTGHSLNLYGYCGDTECQDAFRKK
ncbi:ferric iron uptake transcriptional regulator [Acinetobacter radioresistens]|uniref:ferric iron uptake transcriptional regulator n=1 Tax=Acinetobacter radioresistens TaxID=40216 RepID=UPI000D0BDB19|nr:ferric iron uptake transcriptional regulator [Acinetobacter radioresistens]PSD39707.1 ferric iron uptake transcriptional regulator [Acinetobacter radioresistens]